jgi:catechol 2,3-dioxygenase-like lactoylglutathione lyase family enzyme
MIKKLNHTGIVVSNIDQALAFYRDLLGLKVRMDFDVANKEFETLFQSPGARFRVVYFQEDLELIYFYSPGDGKPILHPGVRIWDPGNVVLIFAVSDVEKMYSNLIEKGVKFIAPPQSPESPVPTVGKTIVAHVEGPDGIRISLVETLRDK